MPAQWTGELIGKLHNAGITQKAFAARIGLHEKYVSQLLNGKKEVKGAEQRFCAALNGPAAADTRTFCARYSS